MRIKVSVDKQQEGLIQSLCIHTLGTAVDAIAGLE